MIVINADKTGRALSPFPPPDQSGGYRHPKSAEPDSHPASVGFGENISADFKLNNEVNNKSYRYTYECI